MSDYDTFLGLVEPHPAEGILVRFGEKGVGDHDVPVEDRFPK